MSRSTENQSIEPPVFHIRYALKITIIVTILIIVVSFAINLLLIERIAGSKIRQIEAIGKTTSILVADFALNSLENRQIEQLNTALDKLYADVITQNDGFLEISVISYPSGTYFSSTTKEYRNKRVHPSLLSKIEENHLPETLIEKQKFKINDRILPVIQFLKNITINNGGDQVRIATTHILYDYSRLIKTTQRELFVATGIVWIVAIFTIFAILTPVSLVHKNLIGALNQIGEENFRYRLPIFSRDELGLISQAFNQAASNLKRASKERAVTPKSTGPSTETVHLDLSLRKSIITCLCTRIPNIAATLPNATASEVVENVENFLIPIGSIAIENGGQIGKIFGDKVYLFFEGVNSIDNAIRTALKFTATWQESNHERKILNRTLQDFGIGLHAAPGVTGILATPNSEATIVGEVLEIANYLCTIAGREEILISSSMLEKSNGDYQHQEIAELKSVQLPAEMEVLVIRSQPREEHTSEELYKAHMYSSTERSFESAVPDMLAETMQATPFEIVDAEEEHEMPPVADAHPVEDLDEIHGLASNEEVEFGDSPSGSLWDIYMPETHKVSDP